MVEAGALGTLERGLGRQERPGEPVRFFLLPVVEVACDAVGEREQLAVLVVQDEVA